MTEPLLTAKELAKILRVKERSIRHWTRRYGLPSLIMGRSRYYRLSQVEPWIEQRNAPQILSSMLSEPKSISKLDELSRDNSKTNTTMTRPLDDEKEAG